jgi:hypothetical protein
MEAHMATETFYVKKEDVDDFKKAKELLGDGYSPYIMKSLKSYLIEREIQDKSYGEIIIFNGTKNPEDKTCAGENVKFVGKELSKGEVKFDKSISTFFVLYLTRKGKLLLEMKHYDYSGFRSEHYSYDVKDRIQDFKEYNLPHDLLSDAEKKMPGITCKVLDI